MNSVEAAVRLRRALHDSAELSGMEERTSALVRGHLETTKPDSIVDGLGGHGVAAVYTGEAGGPRVLVRCELDALPIPETGERDGADAAVSHKCGHDGHMAIAAALAGSLGESPPALGSAVLLFQPSEENGAGAKRVLDDPAFSPLRPDVVVALHNVPGYPLGTVVLRDGVFASTARSLRVDLFGRTSHAAEPERGLSPGAALAEILSAWPGVPGTVTSVDEPALVTVVHCRLGELALGTNPGTATAVATLRAQSEDVMGRISLACAALAEGIGRAHGLDVEIAWLDEFPCTVSDASVNAVIERAALSAGLPVLRLERPFAWTEDFGHFTREFRGALFGLGAGEATAPLHHPDYSFPDELVPLGAGLLRRTVDAALSGDSG